MKMPDNHVVCGLCREIIHKDETQSYVESYEWGSLDGRPHYGRCCKTHDLDVHGHPTGQYAIKYA